MRYSIIMSVLESESLIRYWFFERKKAPNSFQYYTLPKVIQKTRFVQMFYLCCVHQFYCTVMSLIRPCHCVGSTIILYAVKLHTIIHCSKLEKLFALFDWLYQHSSGGWLHPRHIWGEWSASPTPSVTSAPPLQAVYNFKKEVVL